MKLLAQRPLKNIESDLDVMRAAGGDTTEAREQGKLAMAQYPVTLAPVINLADHGVNQASFKHGVLSAKHG